MESRNKKRLGAWSLEQAQTVFKSIEPIAKDYGFLLAIGGSVISNGQGRDLDLIAVAVDPVSDAEKMLMEIMHTTGASRSGIEHIGKTGTRTIGLLCESKMIDLMIVSTGRER